METNLKKNENLISVILLLRQHLHRILYRNYCWQQKNLLFFNS